ncbi:MAG: PSP1 domain-containing protein [Gemmatimonadaceae bacterium]
MAHLVEVAFKGNRKEFFLWDYPEPPALKAAIIVDADRGEDLGHVHALGDLAEKRNGGCAHGCGTSAPTRKALRLANTRDKATAEELGHQNDEVRRKAMDRVRANGLAMKLTDAEWQWDRKKLTFYFTAEKRVDFRNLVRDLASLFHTRIELKQIGVRDEARRLDGIGRCGRQYCSASWLPELRPVNLGVAKDQRLSLNPAQISGACGRLMCCLRYEHEFYVQSRKRFPKEGKIVVTSRGEEKVLAIDIFREQLTLRNVEGETRVVALIDFDREVADCANGVSSREVLEPDEEPGDALFEISPELMYTREHEIPAAREHMVLEAAPAESAVVDGEEGSRAGDRDGTGAKRRRGRRGGRRGRGGEQGDR